MDTLHSPDVCQLAEVRGRSEGGHYAIRYNAGDVVPPTANPFPTRFTACIPSVPRPPVRPHIYFIAYERAIHLFVFPSFSHRLTAAQNVLLEHSVCLPVTIYGWARLILVSCPNVNLSFFGSSSCRSWPLSSLDGQS